MKKKKYIAGSFIYQYYQRRCPYFVSLFLQGLKVETSLGKLEKYFIDQGIAREARYFHLLKETFGKEMVLLEKDPNLSFEEDLAKRADETAFWMKKGKKIICHAILLAQEGIQNLQEALIKKYNLPFQPFFRGEPDILFRRDGVSSAFGNYIYEVGDVKSSYSFKFCQQLQVTYYSFLLADYQKTYPITGYIILQNRKGGFPLYSFSLEETFWTLEHLLKEEIWEYFQEKENFYHLDSHCKGCGYFSFCEEKAKDSLDLSLLPGIRRSQKKALWQLGFTSIPDLAKAKEEDLRKTSLFGISTEQVLPFLAMSRSLTHKKMYYRPPRKAPQQVIEELTLYVELDQEYRAYRKHLHLHSQGELIFLDISSDVYLEETMITLLRGNQISFFSSSPIHSHYGSLEDFWEEVKLALQVSGEITFIHYGRDLKKKILPLAEARKDFSLFEFLLSIASLDLQKVLQRLLILPLPSYHLPEVIHFFETKKEERSSFFTLPPHLKKEFSLAKEELWDIPNTLLLRMWLEKEEDKWIKGLEWKMEETVKAIKYIFHILQHLEDFFPELKEDQKVISRK